MWKLIVVIALFASVIIYSNSREIGASTVTRAFSSSTIQPGAPFSVKYTSTASRFWTVEETVPIGFTVTLSPIRTDWSFDSTTRVFKFYVQDSTDYTVTYTASSTTGSYTYNGVFYAYGDDNIYTIYPPWVVSVCVPTTEFTQHLQDWLHGTITLNQLIPYVKAYLTGGCA